MKRRNNKNTAIDPWIFLDGPRQNAQRNPLVKYYTSLQSCLKRRRHLRPLSTLFLTLTHLTSAKWQHMSTFRSVYIWRIYYSSLPSLRISFWAWADMQAKITHALPDVRDLRTSGNGCYQSPSVSSTTWSKETEALGTRMCLVMKLEPSVIYWLRTNEADVWNATEFLGSILQQLIISILTQAREFLLVDTKCRRHPISGRIKLGINWNNVRL